LMVLLPLVWIVYYLVNQMMIRGSIHMNWKQVVDSPIWEAASYLPPGMAAHAVASAQQGDVLSALGWCSALGVVTLGTVLLATAVLKKVYAGESDVVRWSGRGRTAAEPAPKVAKARRDSSDRLPFRIKLSPAAEAVYIKEMRYMARDPSFKAAFMNLLYTLVIAVFMVMPKGEANVPVNLMVWPASMIVLMSEMRFFFNFFGTEGAAASLFFLYPASRRDMLVGKDVVYFIVAGVINVALAAILCAVSGVLTELPYLIIWMLLATGFYVATGNVMSIMFPMQVVARGRKVRQTSAGQGCALGLLYMGVSVGSVVALSPVIAAIAVPRLWIGEVWMFLTIPLAACLVYGALFVSLKISERLLLQREIELMRKLGAEE
jgi:hypothetical protein